MKGWIISISILLFCLSIKANTYFVDSSNQSEGNGSQLSPWRSISQATSSNLQPGDIVFIKAGEYGNENLVLQSDGNLNEPIIFRGYKEFPGDNPQAAYPRYGLNIDDMPTLTGDHPGDGIAIDLNGKSYVHFENIQIRKYRLGIRNMRAPHESSTGIKLKNIVGHTFGIQSNDRYSGWGILIDDEYNEIIDCQIIDAGAECFGIYGDYNNISNCHAGNYSDINATDYFIMTWGDHNIIDKCSVHRASYIQSHSGHGIGSKNGSNNQFIDCVSVNTNKGFYASGPESHHNFFRNCVAQNAVGLVVREGAHHNTFDGCVITNTEVAVRFFDSEEFGEQSMSAGSNNLFVNCLFEHNSTVIDLWNGIYNSPVHSNLFVNCIMNDAKNLFSTKAPNIDNFLVNCVIYNVELYNEQVSSIQSEECFHVLKNCRLWENKFSQAEVLGSNILESDPQFLNASTSDFRPSENSNLIDKGVDSLVTEYDFIGTFRPYDGNNDGLYYMDIGIYEFTEELLLNDSSANQIAAGQINPFNYEDSVAIVIGQNQINSDFHFLNELTSRYKVYPTVLLQSKDIFLNINKRENPCPNYLSLSDNTGNVIEQWTPCSEKIYLPHSLEAGVYFLNFFEGKNKEVHRIVIQ